MAWGTATAATVQPREGVRPGLGEAVAPQGVEGRDDAQQPRGGRASRSGKLVHGSVSSSPAQDS